MDSGPKIPLPVMVICLRVAGCICPLAAFVVAGVTNMGDAAGWGMVLGSLPVALLWFALGSVIQLLDRIDRRLSASRTQVGFSKQ